jgi:hypothetical protein
MCYDEGAMEHEHKSTPRKRVKKTAEKKPLRKRKKVVDPVSEPAVATAPVVSHTPVSAPAPTSEPLTEAATPSVEVAPPPELPRFLLVAVPMGPDTDEERLFIYNERERIAQELSTYKGRNWLKTLAGVAGGPTREQLERYHHALDVYENVISMYQFEVAEGLIPFRITVQNIGLETDHNIKIRVAVHDGAILLAKKMPQRPKRPDGPQHEAEPTTYDLLSGFVRRDIRLSSRSLRAEFSALKPGAMADLVNQTFFLHILPETVMTYELTSQEGGTSQGVVEL